MKTDPAIVQITVLYKIVISSDCSTVGGLNLAG